jgi:hypothetical protein
LDAAARHGTIAVAHRLSTIQKPILSACSITAGWVEQGTHAGAYYGRSERLILSWWRCRGCWIGRRSSLAAIKCAASAWRDNIHTVCKNQEPCYESPRSPRLIPFLHQITAVRFFFVFSFLGNITYSRERGLRNNHHYLTTLP